VDAGGMCHSLDNIKYIQYRNNFPPDPFCKCEWNTLMVFAGMRSIVTKELFLTFARQIQQNGKGGNSEEQSKELILHQIISHKNNMIQL
jgi:hypothetical protein